jgi:hypothetical protein
MMERARGIGGEELDKHFVRDGEGDFLIARLLTLEFHHGMVRAHDLGSLGVCHI